MRATIRLAIDKVTLEAIKKLALPRETPNGTLRRILGLPEWADGRGRPRTRPKKKRNIATV